MGVAICWTVVVPHDGSALSLAETAGRVSELGGYEVYQADTFDNEETFLHLSDDAPWAMLVDRSDHYVALFEYNGFRGVYSPVLPRLSVGGRAYGVYWNVNAINAMYAEKATKLPGWDRWPQV